jgi:5-(aminomethyl)-3-furanmethanol phosphate kinase
VIVVKVGGSLFDHPRLGPGLAAYLDSLAPAEVVLVPGGGRVVDAVRDLDRVHGLGDDVSHRLAVWALSVAAEFLTHAVAQPAQQGGGSRRSAARASSGPRVRVLDCYRFVVDDESRPGRLPHSWDVTSDSIAARAAVVDDAERLVLLKSVDVPPGTPWDEAAKRGWVDPHFPKVVAGAAFPVEVVNFRRVLDSLGHVELLDDERRRVGG